MALFGDDLGSMITLYYLLKPISTEPPTRIVREGSKAYIATPEALTNIINDIDALIYTQEGDTEHAGIANRVVSIIKPLLDIGGMLGVEGELEYETLGELVGLVVNELVFTDSIVNMLVKLLYPMIADLLVDLMENLTDIKFVNNTVSSLLNSVIDDNKLAIYPNKLGDLIDTDSDTKGKYTSAANILKNAGDNWDNVNFDELSWGVDAAPTSQKADAFLDALCAGLGGFTRLLVVVMCGGSANEGGDQLALKDKDNFGRYFDLELIPLVGGWIASQGMYTKLFIPLFRVLGLEEGKDFMTTLEFHTSIVNSNGIFLKNCLRNILKPIITFITDYVAKHPIETVMKLVPNLTHFLSRTGSGAYRGYLDVWTDDGFAGGFLGDRQEEMHEGYATLQTENLSTILDNFHIFISVVGSGIYIGSIGSLLPGGTFDMLSSLNGLLNELISFAYDTGGIASENPVCYSQWDQVSSIYLYEGPVVLPDSEEYLENPAAYPTPHTRYYYNPEDETDISLYATGTYTEMKQDLVYAEKDFYIPAIPEGKLISCGTIDSATNTIKVEYPGQVFLFLLRYVLSAVGYKYNTKDKSLPTLIECLGLELDSELFLGLSLGDIVNNVMIHPDEAICALLELFYSGETGDLYLDKDYTYAPEPIDYRNGALLDRTNNPTLSYGVEVEYSQYWTREYANEFIEALGPLAEDVLIMLGLEGVEDGLGPFLRGFIEDSLFTDDLINTVFNLIYQLLAGLKDSLGIDIAPIADAALGIKFDPVTISNVLREMVGDSPALERISTLGDWAALFSTPVIDPDTCDPLLDEEGKPVLDEEGNIVPDLTTGTPLYDEEGKVVTEFQDVELDWGMSDTKLPKGEHMLKTLAALLSPAGFLIKFLFMDQDLSILGLINLPGYAGYQYAFIGLLEALSCPGILTYDQYYEMSASINPETKEANICGDANSIYYLFAPLLSLLEKVYADPINTVLSMIPNLLFFISIGGFNGLVNNLVHFAYVLLDILKPIINGYDLVNNLLANLEIEGLTISLQIPLDVDFNALVSDLLGSLLGDTLTIEGVSIVLPYIDLYSLCVGTVEGFNSKEGRQTVYLNSAGGGDLLTALLRIVCQVLFMDENHEALSQIVANLAEEGRLDEYDEETIYIVIDGLFDLLEEYKVIDIVLMAVYLLVTNVLPIADMLASKLQEKGMTIGDIIDVIDDPAALIDLIMNLLGDEDVDVPGEVDDIEAATSLLDRVKAFFEKIKMFFLKLFPFFA